MFQERNFLLIEIMAKYGMSLQDAKICLDQYKDQEGYEEASKKLQDMIKKKINKGLSL